MDYVETTLNLLFLAFFLALGVWTLWNVFQSLVWVTKRCWFTSSTRHFYRYLWEITEGADVFLVIGCVLALPWFLILTILVWIRRLRGLYLDGFWNPMLILAAIITNMPGSKPAEQTRWIKRSILSHIQEDEDIELFVSVFEKQMERTHDFSPIPSLAYTVHELKEHTIYEFRLLAFLYLRALQYQSGHWDSSIHDWFQRLAVALEFNPQHHPFLLVNNDEYDQLMERAGTRKMPQKERLALLGLPPDATLEDVEQQTCRWLLLVEPSCFESLGAFWQNIAEHRYQQIENLLVSLRRELPAIDE